MTNPGFRATVDLALRHVPPGARVALVHDADALRLMDAAGHAASVRDRLEGPTDAIVAFGPSRHGPLLRFLAEAHDALPPAGVLVVADAVWQTAPTAELLKAFAPPPGLERIRPVEGYEMQLEHAGFDVAEKVAFGREEWLAVLPPGERRDAVLSDARGALRWVVWALRRGADG